jgi:hypothetical protein
MTFHGFDPKIWVSDSLCGCSGCTAPGKFGDDFTWVRSKNLGQRLQLYVVAVGAQHPENWQNRKNWQTVASIEQFLFSISSFEKTLSNFPAQPAPNLMKQNRHMTSNWFWFCYFNNNLSRRKSTVKNVTKHTEVYKNEERNERKENHVAHEVLD